MPVNLRSGCSLLRSVSDDASNDKYCGKDDKKINAATRTEKMVYVIFIGLVIDLLGFTLILPLLPALLEHYKANDSPDGLYNIMEVNVRWFGSLLGAPDRFIPVLFGGLIGSLFSFLQFIAAPLMGGLSDYYGRRPLMLLSTCGIAFSYAVWSCAGTFSLFVIARIIGGLSKGNVSLATAIITDVSSYRTRQHGMALVGIAFSIGFLVGPLIGAGFAIHSTSHGDNGLIYPALVALSLGILDVLFFYFFFEETLPLEKRVRELSSVLKQVTSYINPVCLFNFSSLSNLPPNDLAALVTLGRSNFIYLFLYSGLEFTLTFLTHLRFGFTAVDQGKMFFYVGCLMAIIQGGYVRRIKPGTEKRLVLLGLIIIVPAFAVIGFAQSRALLYLGLTLYALSTSVIVPCLATLVSSYGDVSQKGIVMGVYRSLGSLGRALGPIFASALYWVAGPEICYSVGGLGLIVPYLMLKNSFAT